MLTLGKTGFFALGSNRCIGNLGVSESLNSFLFYKYLVTNRAVLTLGKTCVFTVGSNSRIGNLGVTESRNRLLCLENLATDRALLTFGKTGLLAGRLLGGNNLLGMICAEIRITYVADKILGVFVGVTVCGNNLLCLSVVTS